MKESLEQLNRLFEYIKNGTSAFKVIEHSKKLLLKAGFNELNLKDNWQLKKGGRYFVIPFSTTLYAFTVGEDCDLSCGIHAAGAHTDFPAIKIKPNPQIRNHGYLQLNTEVYGGPILSTFFDRPLSLSGKIVTRGTTYDKPVSHIVDFKRPIVYIPNLAIHMNRSVNETGSPIDNQKHLLPIVSTSEDLTWDEILSKEIGVPATDILDYDLCIYNPEEPMLVGYDNEFISAPRLDDITSVCALIYGLIESNNKSRINMACLFDNEEIGSLSKQGANSTLPATILGKIWQSFGKTQVDCMADISDGFMLSVDVAHAYHPAYPSTQDITNYPLPNKGIMLKTTSNQSYSWDPEILGGLIDLCKRHDIPCQRFVKHSNIKGGGTIGSIISSHLPMRAADLGVGIIAMHSSREFMGAADQIALERFIAAFYQE